MTDHVPPPGGPAVPPPSDDWIRLRDHQFQVDVLTTLEKHDGRLNTLETNKREAKETRRWLIGTILVGMIASSAITSVILMIWVQAG